MADGTVHLPEQEWRHAVRVRRCNTGDEIEVVDGMGVCYRVRLVSLRGQGMVIESEPELGEPVRQLTIALALLKSSKRYETFLEKAVELGARRIIPLLTKRTYPTALRSGRAHRVLVAAMKQCARCRIPELLPPQSLSEVLRSGTEQQMVMCRRDAAGRLSPGDNNVTILVGPEGGFAKDEAEQAVEAGVALVSLSGQRLRAETAAIAAMALAMSPGIPETTNPQRC